jgi:hypothetical protein
LENNRACAILLGIRHRFRFRNSEGNHGNNGIADGQFAVIAERILA